MSKKLSQSSIIADRITAVERLKLGSCDDCKWVSKDNRSCNNKKYEDCNLFTNSLFEPIQLGRLNESECLTHYPNIKSWLQCNQRYTNTSYHLDINNQVFRNRIYKELIDVAVKSGKERNYYWCKITEQRKKRGELLVDIVNIVNKKLEMQNTDFKMEYILCAAIDYNGIIISGHRHRNCNDVLRKLKQGIKETEIPNRDKQGFLTSENRYVNRGEAFVIAKKQNQIINRIIIDFDKCDLTSEDLY